MNNNWSVQIPYNESSVKRGVPSAPGVYRLIYPVGAKRYAFYVGQSQDLQARALAHLQVSEPNACIRSRVRLSPCYIDYVVIYSQVERARVEREEIRRLNPACNQT